MPPSAIRIPPSCLASGKFARALLLALHLNDALLVRRVVDGTPLNAVRLVASAIPATFLARLLEVISASLMPDHAEGGILAVAPTPHLEFALTWCLSLLELNGSALRSHPGLFTAGLRSIQRSLLYHRETLGKLCVTCRSFVHHFAFPSFNTSLSLRMIGMQMYCKPLLSRVPQCRGSHNSCFCC